MQIKNKVPTTLNAWLKETAEAYNDAVETIPFGRFIDREIKVNDLFHLAPAICLKFRGIKKTTLPDGDQVFHLFYELLTDDTNLPALLISDRL